MATYRRNTVWFWMLLVVFVVGGYAGLTYAVAGNEASCNGGYGSIEWVWSPVPRFECTIRARF